MNIAYLNSFLLASFSVLETVVGKQPVRGQVTVQSSTFPSQECNVICGVTGQAQGQVIYSMALDTAQNIAGAMLGSPVAEFDVLASSAIAELGNMISGGAMHHLGEAGIICDITPPSLLEGAGVSVSTIGATAVVVPLATEHGPVTLTIGLQAKN